MRANCEFLIWIVNFEFRSGISNYDSELQILLLISANWRYHQALPKM